MDTKLFPEGAAAPGIEPLPADRLGDLRDVVSPRAATWTPSKPTIDQTRQVAIQTIQQNFQAIDEQLFAAGFVRKSGDTMTGPLNWNGGGPAWLTWLQSGLLRWQWQVGGAESGGNVGSNMVLYAFTDAGAVNSNPVISVTRATGGVAFGFPATTPNLIASNAVADGNTPATSQILANASGGPSGGIAMVTWQVPGDRIVAALVAGNAGKLFIKKADTSGAFISAGVFEGATLKYSPGAGAIATLANLSANSFVVNNPAGGCTVAMAAALSTGVIYRVLIRNTQNGAVTWPASFRFPVGTPPIGASANNRAVVTFWWSDDDAAAYCNVAQY